MSNNSGVSIEERHLAYKTKIYNYDVTVIHAKCPTSKYFISIEAKSQEAFGDVIKGLTYVVPIQKIAFDEEMNCATLKLFDRLIGIYSDGRISFCAENLNDAAEVLRGIDEALRKAREYVKLHGTPSNSDIKRLLKLNAIELYKYLPKTNCRKCGESTCLAFAVKVLLGDRKLRECPLLSEKDFDGIKKTYGTVASIALGIA
ncbi:MAG: (Fe-S)-binding protein [Desulfurococcaceae archaeon]